MSAPTLANAPQSVMDELVALVCEVQAEAWGRGHAQGYAEGLRDGREDTQAAAVWPQAAAVARNVASDRTRTWAAPGEPQRVGWGWSA